MNDRSFVVMDVEGVVIPKRRFILLVALKRLSVVNFLKVLLFGVLYEIGFFSLGSTLQRIYSFFKGLSYVELFNDFKNLPSIPGTEEFIAELKDLGYKVAFISSGLPDVFIKNLAKRLKVDLAFGLKLGVREGRITGEVEGDLLKDNGKAIILERILAQQGLAPSNCIIIVDDKNNLPMFPFSSLRIGYKPDFIISFKSDYVTDNLQKIMPLLKNKNVSYSISCSFEKNEIFRKIIHIGSSLIPLICIYLLTRWIVSFLLLVVIVIYIISEIARLCDIEVPLLSNITQIAANKSELYDFIVSPIYFALGISLSLIFFPAPVCYAAILILTLGDGSSSFFGKLLGKHVIPFNKGKTVEGTLFGFVIAFLSCLFFVSPSISFLGAALGMLTEILPLPLNDNLTIPLVAGTSMLLFL